MSVWKTACPEWVVAKDRAELKTVLLQQGYEGEDADEEAEDATQMESDHPIPVYYEEDPRQVLRTGEDVLRGCPAGASFTQPGDSGVEVTASAAAWEQWVLEDNPDVDCGRMFASSEWP